MYENFNPKIEKFQGILNDQQIADLCRPPVGALVYTYPYENNRQLHVEPIYLNEEKARELLWLEQNRWQELRVELEYYTVEEANKFPVMISPFVDHQVRSKQVLEGVGSHVEPVQEKIISYGLSSFGYDFRVADEFKIFTNAMSTMVDPKAFDPKAFVEFKGDVCVIPPNSFVLARTLERFSMPKDVVGMCLGKSTYARVGINCLVTPAEPGWEGYLTLEFANCTPLPAKLYANEGALQIAFFRGERPNVTYADRNGKYQNQAAEVTLPRT